jgi:hypothetical protein
LVKFDTDDFDVQLTKFLTENIKEILVEVVVPKVKEVEIETIWDVVYGVYPNPKQYQRRGSNGGLLDKENIIHVPLFGGFYYSIRNITRKYQRDEYLAPLIEYGHNRAISMGDIGYEYPRHGLAYMQPRPFVQMTIQRLVLGKEHELAMRQGLKSMGFEFK